MGLGRLLILAGLGIALLGLLVLLAERLHLPFGRLPGDLVWRGRTTTIYFPIVTCLVLSGLGTLILWLLNGRR